MTHFHVSGIFNHWCFQAEKTCFVQTCFKIFKWTLTVNTNITVEKGSDVNIPCQFSYPEKHHTQDVKVYWKTDGTSVCSKTDNDKMAFVFHPNQTCVLPEYRGRTKLIGNETSGDCSLQIMNITMGGVIYVRIVAKGDQNSFKKQNVSISLKGENPSQT
uniref:Immunoglobulin V-set domain-containing protein n=1 Tax=Oryzias sinensis TaxID=183150 RepID=A0A8C7XXA2_9TELE